MWTENLIVQIYNAGCDTASLRTLLKKIAAESDGQPDLATLRWIWEECERADARNRHLAVKFRNPKLLTRGPITDDRLPKLWSLNKVVELDLTGTQVTDGGLVHLKDLGNVKYLYLSGTNVTDDGLAHIKEMTGLQCLQLDNTAVTDDGIMQLRDMANLEELSVHRTAVTPEGKEKLRKAQPHLTVGS